MTKGLAFFDTNVFLHAEGSSAPALVSLQVLQEYFAVATRKPGVAPELAQQKVEQMSGMRVVRMEAPDVISAIEFHRLHQVSFWDALIVHAARAGGAEILFTEDLQSGTNWRGVTVVNPFERG